MSDMKRLQEIADEWYDHSEYLYESDDRRSQGMARGYRSCAEELQKYIDTE